MELPWQENDRAYPVVSRCIAQARLPNPREVRFLALRIMRESSPGGHAWSFAEKRRVIRMARAAVCGSVN